MYRRSIFFSFFSTACGTFSFVQVPKASFSFKFFASFFFVDKRLDILICLTVFHSKFLLSFLSPLCLTSAIKGLISSSLPFFFWLFPIIAVGFAYRCRA